MRLLREVKSLKRLLIKLLIIRKKVKNSLMSTTGKIPLAIVGCDFRIASSSLRSRLVLDDKELIELTNDLKRAMAANGLVELCTCNRNEWIISTSNPEWAATLLASRMIMRLGSQASKGFSPYVFTGEEAARHIFRVALGQESLVVGERQISGQIQKALNRAKKLGTSARIFNGLGNVIGRMVRKIIRSGGLLQGSVGVHSLAVSFLKSRTPAYTVARVAVVGLGQIGKKVLGVLEQETPWEIAVLNRTASTWGHGHHCVTPITELISILNQVDAAIICTSAKVPIIRTADILSRTVENPLILLDLGIPEQVDRTVNQENVYVWGLDNLISFYFQAGTRQISALKFECEIENAIREIKFFCSRREIAEILNAIEQSHDFAVKQTIPEILENHLELVPKPIRNALADEIQSAILRISNQLFQQVRQVTSSCKHLE